MKNFYKLASCAFAIATLVLPGVAVASRVVYGFEDSKVIGGSGDDSVWASAVDSDGNLFVAGLYEGTVDFNPDGEPDEHSSVEDSADIFVTKYDEDGNYEWTKTFGSNGTSDTVSGLAVDSEGNVVVVGQYSHDIDLDPGAGEDIQPEFGDNDTFVVKLDGDGNYVWGDGFGGDGDTWGYKVAIDSNDNVLVAGGFTGTTDFASPDDVHTEYESEGDYDGFVSIYDSDGVNQGVKLATGTGYQFIEGIDLDSNNNIFIGVTYEDVTNVNGTVFGNDGDSDTLLARLDGNSLLVDTFAVIHSAYEVTVDDIKVDADDNAYVVGTFYDTTDFDPGEATEERTQVGDDYDAYLAKYMNNGAFEWVQTVGGTEEEDSNTVNVDADGNVYWGGRYRSDDVDFDPTNGEDIKNNAEEGTREGFVSVYGSDGSYKTTLTVSGGNGGDEVTTIATDHQNDRTYVGGEIDGDAEDIGLSRGGVDGFITTLKIDTLYNIIGLPSNLDVEEAGTNDFLDDLTNGGIDPGTDKDLRISKASDGTAIAETKADVLQDLDWSGVSGNADASTGKSVINGLGDAEGTASTHSLLVPKLPGDDAVGICPEASSMADVSLDCANLQQHDEDDSDTSVVTIDGKTYWKVDGLPGTGGFSSTSAELSDSLGLLVDTGDGTIGYTIIGAGLVSAPLALVAINRRRLLIGR